MQLWLLVMAAISGARINMSSLGPIAARKHSLVILMELISFLIALYMKWKILLYKTMEVTKMGQ
jgi:hypothetical protein